MKQKLPLKIKKKIWRIFKQSEINIDQYITKNPKNKIKETSFHFLALKLKVKVHENGLKIKIFCSYVIFYIEKIQYLYIYNILDVVLLVITRHIEYINFSQEKIKSCMEYDLLH